VISRNLKLPENVREFSSRTCETMLLPEIEVALYRHSFPNRAVLEDLSAGYRDRVKGTLNIGVLHTSADDPGEHETCAPLQRRGADAEGVRLLGVGPHSRATGAVRAALDRVPRQPPGTPSRGKWSKRLHVGHRRRRHRDLAEHRAVDVLRWMTLGVDAGGADVVTLTGRVERSIRAAIEAADGRSALERLEQWADGGTDQEVEDAQARHVWPGQR